MKRKTVISGFVAFAIIIASQLLWKVWAQRLAFYPFGGAMHWLFRETITMICVQVEVILQVFKPVNFLLIGNRFYFPGGESVLIASGCTGIKQIFHFVCLILSSLSGSVRKKIIWIIGGITILMNFNILRISVLCVIRQFIPIYWDYFHSTIFRFAYYVIILLLWILWEESRLLSGSSLKNKKNDYC